MKTLKLTNHELNYIIGGLDGHLVELSRDHSAAIEGNAPPGADDLDGIEQAINEVADLKARLETRFFEPEDEDIPGRLQDLANHANAFGAEGVWLIRGVTNARLLYDVANVRQPSPPGASMNVTINFEIADAGVLILMRFPGDGGEAGIESR